MLITDYIKIYENGMPPDLCDELITHFDNSPNVTETRNELPGNVVVESYLELNLAQEPLFEAIKPVLFKITELATNKYQSEIPAKTFPQDIGCEMFRMKKYRIGPEFDDHFAYHVDVNSHSSARRYLALHWYLNDVAEGGETLFPHPNLRIKPQKGRLLMFPSLWTYPHSGERAISGDKYILSTYLHYIDRQP